MSIFSFKGRIGRLHYFLHSLAGTLLFALFLIWLAFTAEAKGSGEPGLVTVLLILAYFIAGVLAEICVTVRRLHDLGRSGWHYLLLSVPLYNIYLGLALLFQKGTDGANV